MTETAIDSILIPTDGSEGALAGAKRGLDLAGAVEADVHVLSVVDTSEFEGLSGLLETDPDEHRAALEAQAEAAVDSVEAVIDERNPELEVATATERGIPYRAIERYVDAAGVDLVAMGTRGQSGLERVVLGSVTENVLRTVDVPVLAVSPAAGDSSLARDDVETILLPTDGSEAATVAVEWGIGLATILDAAVHAIYSADTGRFADGAEPSNVLVELERVGEEAIETVRDRAEESGVSVTGTTARGPPARVILDTVDETGSDLLVVGTHGRAGLERQLLGSVTEKIVRDADVPVVCVPVGVE